ncbi:hypothetical protein MKK69_04385 [Methylobacterium sp. J-026]|uniref:hypothetical protein n=1 Tax=Methylobacterium sp. J-026 TaxID=2836624 RepID=UPI001FBA93D4|nr:hypothetical protein [Methylobacterium sp. J-026]MCJ2133309.1 hypothetical protein [Methylobacterium sp. J-026]
MDAVEDQRDVVLHNLVKHAGPARARLRLSLPDAARLVHVEPELIAGIEKGGDCMAPLIVLTQFALFLGLNELGLPRPQPAGME